MFTLYDFLNLNFMSSNKFKTFGKIFVKIPITLLDLTFTSLDFDLNFPLIGLWIKY